MSRLCPRRAHGSVDPAKPNDPVALVMRKHNVPDMVSQEEFLEICKERILDLMMEEVLLDEERGQGRGWNENLPIR